MITHRDGFVMPAPDVHERGNSAFNKTAFSEHALQSTAASEYLAGVEAWRK